MRRLKIVFLINPLSEMKFREDTTFSIMAECQKRSHVLYTLESQDLLLHGPILYGNAAACSIDPKSGVSSGKRRWLDLRKVNCIFLRKEPPFNADYLACTYLLDFLANDTFVINNPTGVRDANEKLSSMVFSRWTPETVVSYKYKLPLHVTRRLGRKRVVLKRIDEKGGTGIHETSDLQIARGVFGLLREQSGAPVMIQQFVSHELKGDKRVLLLDGRVLGAFTRIPGAKDFRANMSVGAKAAPAQLTARDQQIVARMAPYLRKKRLYLAGIDLLDGKLTEINVTSPAGIPEINAWSNLSLEHKVVDFIERKSA